MRDYPSGNLESLNRIHGQLEILFHRHQEALLAGNGPWAVSLLKDYEEALLRHIQEEDKLLMPLYEKRADIQVGGGPEIFLGEHRKIEEWLGRLNLRVQRLGPPPLESAPLIALLDDEAHFKKYLEHHTLREDRLFYPEIERLLTAGEKAGLLRLLTLALPEKEREPQHF